MRVYDPEEEVVLTPVADHLSSILAQIEPLASEDVQLSDAWGCVLAEDVHAPMDLPTFTSSAMDGFAVRASDVAGAKPDAPVELSCVGEVRMGTAAIATVGPGEAVAVSTGAIVPIGADAVVPIELCARQDDKLFVLREVPIGKHVRPAGEDIKSGDLLIPRGTRLAAPDLGALAAAGHGHVRVIPPAQVGVMSTGDELVRPGTPLGAGQIYDANVFTVGAAVLEAGCVPLDAGCVRDDPEELKAALDAMIGQVDVIVCSGGVSMGEHDPVKRAFEIGGEVDFVNVAMQPGRPQAFGAWRGTPFFGLPGNPVSVFVSFEVFVRPALMKMMGRPDERRTVEAVLEAPLEAPRTRARYARVRIRTDGYRVVATPEGGHQSNLLATFSRADGLAVVPPATRLEEGQTCPVILIRNA